MVFTLTNPDINPPLPGLACGLTSIGISAWESARYELKIKQGNILISVQTANSAELTPAREIFQAAGALDIWGLGEESSR